MLVRTILYGIASFLFLVTLPFLASIFAPVLFFALFLLLLFSLGDTGKVLGIILIAILVLVSAPHLFAILLLVFFFSLFIR